MLTETAIQQNLIARGENSKWAKTESPSKRQERRDLGGSRARGTKTVIASTAIRVCTVLEVSGTNYSYRSVYSAGG